MHQTNHFFDLGYGWLCKHCSAENTERKQHPDIRSSSFTQGHLQEKESGTTGLAFARWTDSTRRDLVCPRCGIEEVISNV
jgi:DNA-directed RNA polymerase subunit RPC12/RpoP